MKVHIKYNFRDGPWGGANQFLKALRKQFKKKDVYTSDINEADVILFNSHHEIEKVVNLKKVNQDKIFIHRVDGPVYKIRGNHMRTDNLIFRVNDSIADGTVYQTDWCKENNIKLGMPTDNFETTINNSPDADIFNRENKSDFHEDRPRIIATSWSDNWSKGFGVYKYLDENLDFEEFDMTFIGNSPVEFENINKIDPLPSEEIAEQLKKHDIFITASENDPCSNALIEALSCGLPAAVLNDGGHPELIGQGGEAFEGKEDVIDAIKRIANNYKKYQNNIPDFSIESKAEKYLSFMEEIYKKQQSGKYKPKRLSNYDIYMIKVRLIYNFILSLPHRIRNYLNNKD
ncbi:MAG: glycosyltransferase [Candidatus Paceibacteria bacterium]